MVETKDFHAQGFAIVLNVLSHEEADRLIEDASFDDLGSTHNRQGRAYGNRHALEHPAIQSLAGSPSVARLVGSVLPGAFAVRAILFDKVPGANWKVPWHQDWTIMVKESADVEGYGPWSVKEGLPHVQAPSEVLERMVAIRLHLDDCGPENGPLRVKPGTHLYGRVPKEEARVRSADIPEEALVCRKGDAILMSPLLLHASSPANSPNHRRVVHIEFANCDLAPPLEWAHRIS